MSLLKSLISVCLLTLAMGFIGCQDKGGGGPPAPTPTPKPSPTPTALCKPLEKPCVGEGPSGQPRLLRMLRGWLLARRAG